jgi:hypothetical protein
MIRCPIHISIGLALALLTLVGCTVNRPEPRTVEPGFSYVEHGDRNLAAYWPDDHDELANRPKLLNQPLLTDPWLPAPQPTVEP